MYSIFIDSFFYKYMCTVKSKSIYYMWILRVKITTFLRNGISKEYKNLTYGMHPLSGKIGK